MPRATRLEALQQRVVHCTRCPRLIEYCRRVAIAKRPKYRDSGYWGRPLPSFGDPEAELLILGLAPAAHGGNRTGRMFTGDRSGDFLFRALFEAGFASQPFSRDRADGLKLRNCYITAALRCAPPANKPLPEELLHCAPYMDEELRLLRRVRAVLALGRIAFDAFLHWLYTGKRYRLPPRSFFRFAHGAQYNLPNGMPLLVACYHPSQQNTQTGKLTPGMMNEVLAQIQDRLLISKAAE